MNRWDKWVVDVTLIKPDYPDLLCFCPVENFGEPNEAIVFGMNLLTTPEGFKERNEGKAVAIIHEGGQEAVDKWCADNPDIVARLKCVKQ